MAYGEPPSVFREDEVRARRNHKCCECGKSIIPGQPYKRFTGLWSSGWATFKLCMWCDVLRRRVLQASRAPYDEGPAFGELHQWISEVVDWCDFMPSATNAPIRYRAKA